MRALLKTVDVSSFTAQRIPELKTKRSGNYIFVNNLLSDLILHLYHFLLKDCTMQKGFLFLFFSIIFVSLCIHHAIYVVIHS